MAGKISSWSTRLFFLGTFLPEDGAGEPVVKISAAQESYFQ